MKSTTLLRTLPVVCIVLLSGSSAVAATTYYVDVTKPCPGSGTQSSPWCQIWYSFGGNGPGFCGDASHLQPGDTVLVLPGTYQNFSFCGKAVTVKPSPEPGVRTITQTGGASKVKFVNNETESSVLDGFRITGGNGLGIECRGAFPTYNASPTIKNCTITLNGTTNGGGILLRDCNARVIDCEITNNGGTTGGGIYILKFSASTPPAPQITGCLIQGNTASSDGGGIAIFKSFPVITNCVISGNTANGLQGGGGIWVNDVSASGGEGGTAANPSCAQGCSGNNRIRFTNCLIVGNSAPYPITPSIGRGGGLFLSLNDPDLAGWTEISNCTISGNTAAGDGDGIFALGRCFTLRNSILWDNGSGGSGSEITLDRASAFLRYDDLEGGLNNIKLIGSLALRCEETNCGTSQILNSNPNFCAAPTDYRLCWASPCIDAGDNAGVAADIADLDGDSNIEEATPFDLDEDPRFAEDPDTLDAGCGGCPVVDMGAYEFPSGGDFITIKPPLDDPKGYCLGGTDNGQLCPPSACPGGSCTLLNKNRTLSFSNPNSGLSALRVTPIDLQHPIPANLPQNPPKNFTTFDLRLNGVCVGGTHPGHHCDERADGLNDCRLCAGGDNANRVCTSNADCPGTNGTCPAIGGTCSSLAACTAENGRGRCARWVGKPGTFLESQDAGPVGGTYRAARLQCTPGTTDYRDWSRLGEDFLGSTDPIDDVIHVVGAEILPSSLYHVHVYPGSCLNNESLCPNVSCPLTITTARWGDVGPDFNPPSITTQPNVFDTEKVISKIKSVPGAPVKAITQLQPNLPNMNADVNALDIAAVVDAVKEKAYAFSGPCACPSTVPCNTTACTSGGQCTGLYGVGSMCVKTCNSGDNVGEPCINNTHCGKCLGGANLGYPCDANADCPLSSCSLDVCGNPGNPTDPGFCRDRCWRCTP